MVVPEGHPEPPEADRQEEGREVSKAEAEVVCTIPVADDLYQTLETMAEEHGLSIEVIVDAIFQMAFEAKSLEEIVEGLKDV